MVFNPNTGRFSLILSIIEQKIISSGSHLPGNTYSSLGTSINQAQPFIGGQYVRCNTPGQYGCSPSGWAIT